MGRVLGVLLALVVVLAGVGVGGVYLFDERIRGEVETQVAANLVESVPFREAPEVDLGGYPVAWHLVTREFPTVRVRGAEAPIPLDTGATLRLIDVDASLHGVRSQPDALYASRLEGTARLTYENLSELAGVPLGYGGEGRLATSGNAQVLGQTITATFTGVPALDASGHTVTIRDPEVDIAGVRLPDSATQALVDALVQPFDVPLPYDLTLAGVRPTPEGLVVEVEGSDVVFPTT